LTIPLKYQLDLGDCKSNVVLSDDIYISKHFISINQVYYRKMISNVRGKEKREIVYPTLTERYLKYNVRNNDIRISEFAH
jgi:hypothetical protein